jgi:hypothetical protein
MLMDLITNLDIEKKYDHNEIYPLFQTKNSYKNLFIISILQKFSSYKDFFSNYSHQNNLISSLNNLLIKISKKMKIFTKKIPKNFNEINDNNEKFIYFITNLIILNYFYVKLNKILMKIGKKIQEMFSYQNDNKNNKTKFDLDLKEKITEFDNSFYNFYHNSLIIHKDSSISRISTKDNTGNFNEFKNIPTPKFIETSGDENNSIEEFDEVKINEIKNLSENLKNSNEKNDFYKKNISPKRRSSMASISSMIFSPVKENLNENLFNNNNNNNNYDSNENIKNKFYRNKSNSFKNLFNNFQKENIKNLFNLTLKMYKNKIINFKERSKLKECIIGKDENLIELYLKYKNEEKEKLYFKIKEFIKNINNNNNNE